MYIHTTLSRLGRGFRVRVRVKARVWVRVRVGLGIGVGIGLGLGLGLQLVPVKVVLMLLVKRSANDHSMKSLCCTADHSPIAADTETGFEVG